VRAFAYLLAFLFIKFSPQSTLSPKNWQRNPIAIMLKRDNTRQHCKPVLQTKPKHTFQQIAVTVFAV